MCAAALDSCDCVAVRSFSSKDTNIVDYSKLCVKIRGNVSSFENIRPFENIPSCHISQFPVAARVENTRLVSVIF